MWGCVQTIAILGVVTIVLLFILGGGGYRYIGSARFAELVRLRIEKNLESRLGRDVSIRKVTVVRRSPQRVLLEDVRIANAPGATQPYFAVVRQVEITGGNNLLQNLLSRNVDLGRIDIRDPKVFFEVFRQGAPLAHNFPSWKRSPPRGYEIVKLDIRKMFISGAALEFLDRRHDIRADVSGIFSEVTPTFSKQIYDGYARGGKVKLKLQQYEPLDLDLRAKFRYIPGILELSSVALNGAGAEFFLAGKVDPLTAGAYDIGVTSRLELARLRQIFRVDKTLDGPISITGRLKGRQGDFQLSGNFASPAITADAYDISKLKGTLDLTGQRATLDIESGRYAGGEISGQYRLSKYGAPYPMSIDLNYDGISLEKLFSDWKVENTGLRGAAVGTLKYEWNKDRILAGAGSGRAKLRRGAEAFGDAPYPVPLSGFADFLLNQGVITFRPSELVTDSSQIGFKGTLKIEDLIADLAVSIRSKDFGELDRIALNFARSAGKRGYKLLDMGGSGTIIGTVRGAFKRPTVVAHLSGSETRYNGVRLGESEIQLRYEGTKSLLTFEPALFRDGNETLTMAGTIGFPDRGPSPRFDLALDAKSWPVEEALAVVGLKLKARGAGTGSLKITGTPESGTVAFTDMDIRRAASNLRVNGDVHWRPGQGNVVLDLDLGATSVPVEEIAAFLDLGALPVTGAVTGTLHIEGPKKQLEGSGAVSLTDGAIYGEAVRSARADLIFTGGKLKATRVEVTADAGIVTGEAEYDFAQENFSYIINSSQIDLSKVRLLASLSKLLGGKVKLSSTGAGTLESPEVVIEATLDEGSFRGVNFPKDAAAPSFYIALRNSNLTIRGNAFDAASIEGTGRLTADNSLDGLVRITVSNLAKLISLFPNAGQLPAEGELIVDLKLGGKITSLETLEIDGSVPSLNVRFLEHVFTAPEPIRFGLRRGVVAIESFNLQREGSNFSMQGSVSLVGDKSINLNVKGNVEAALLQLVVPDVKVDGHVNVAAGISGTLDSPKVTGTAEIQDAEFRLAGFPQLIDEVTGTLVFRGDHVEIDSLKATVGGGTIVAGGSIRLEGLTPSSLSLNLQGTDVAIRLFEGVAVEGDLNLRISGNTDSLLVQGDVVVDQGLYYKDFAIASSLVNLLLERRGLAPAVTASWQDNVNLRVQLIANDTLSVKNNVADVTARAELELTGTLAKPIVLGLVTLGEGGTIRFQDNEYRVVRGTVNFQNPFRIDPYFDVTAEGRVQTEEGGPSQTVDLTINITGTIDRIKPTFTSDPPLGQFGLLSLLGPTAFGQTRGPGFGAGLPTLSQSLLLNSLGGLIGSRVFPFADAFRLDLIGDPTKPKITFEKRVSDSVRVVVVYYTGNTGKESSARDEEYVEWQLSPEWLVQFSREITESSVPNAQDRLGSAHNYALDGKYRRRYRGQWGGEANKEKGTAAYLVSLKPAGSAPTSAAASLPSDSNAPPASAAGAGSDVTIRSVSFRTDAAFDVKPLTTLVTMEQGSAYSIRGVQRAIESLYATGDFRDIQVDAVDAGGVVDLTFILSLNYRIGTVVVEGLGDRDGARRKIEIKSGEVLRLTAVDRNAEDLRKDLVKNGYLTATVDPETTFARQENRADVIFHTTSGKQAIVGAVLLEGDLAPFTREKLLEQMKRGPGKVFRPDEAKRDADRIENFLVRKDHRRAEVRYLGEQIDAPGGEVTTRYRVAVGPVVKVEVSGVPRRSIRRLIPFRRSEGYTQDVLVRAEERIRTEYQTRGHFLASVDYEEKLVGSDWIVTFNVNPGKKYQVREVRFEGNQQLDDGKLEGVVATAPPGGVRRIVASLLRRPTGITPDQLSADRDALESYYKLDGFSEAIVSPPLTATTADGALNVTFPIVEGPRTVVTAVAVEGNEQIETRKLPQLSLKVGNALNPLLLSQDIVSLQTFYSDRGNVEIQVTPDVQYSEGKTAAKVLYKLAEGTRVRTGNVIADGNSYTDSYVILRKAGIKPGQPFSFRNLFEAQRDLYRLGIFQRVDIQPDQSATATGTRNVKIEVEEGKNLTIAGSVGFSSGEALRTSASITHRNLFGKGRYLGLDASVSLPEKRYSATYREPFIFGYDIPTQFTIYKRDTTRNTRDFELAINRYGVFVEASRVFREQTRWSVRYEYRVVSTPCREKEGRDPKVCEDLTIIGREDTRARISSVTPSFFWDKRDDQIDPKRGFFSNASLEYAFPILKSSGEVDDQARFLKQYAQGAWYIGLSRRTLVALSARLGLIHAQGGRSMEDDNRVPYSERFFSGGETSHRAFSLDTLGILEPAGSNPCRDPNPRETIRRICNDDGEVTDIFPIGGNGLLLLSAEYRFPIFGSLSGGLFVDAGNVWRRIGDVAFDELRYGVGAGIRYLTPVGPIRIDYGYKLDRVENENPFAISFTLGYAF
ncbi:MAG TPA: outer membrane protein assembly factor BamA [Thermoanaerobaculia bacterium]|nr:outer membrane protein assembly factor BamA [Thermoanaerobaculia bacterium]